MVDILVEVMVFLLQMTVMSYVLVAYGWYYKTPYRRELIATAICLSLAVLATALTIEASDHMLRDMPKSDRLDLGHGFL